MKRYNRFYCQTCCEAGTESHGSHVDRQVASYPNISIYKDLQYLSF